MNISKENHKMEFGAMMSKFKHFLKFTADQSKYTPPAANLSELSTKIVTIKYSP